MRGHLDALTAGDFAEGWAFDPADLGRVLEIVLRDSYGEEVGRGLANLYRADLARIGYRLGWCAFRLHLSRPAEALRGRTLFLHEATTGAELHASSDPAWRDRPPFEGCASVEAVIAQDPTVVRSIEHLAGCAALLAHHIERHGPAEFVHAAHAYVLARAPDAASATLHERLLRAGALTPLGLLMLLAGSEEFRSAPRLLASPADPGFVFAG
ncbi:hypothetical protein [Falsiroseomonas sp. HW251]|uniref:hypothetical protein n=1 Tax=Falsiroseomonas sp. HW251 TaxID=3390998 RepID=UPI003D31D369